MKKSLYIAIFLVLALWITRAKPANATCRPAQMCAGHAAEHIPWHCMLPPCP